MLKRSLRSRLIAAVGFSVLSLFLISGVAACVIFEASLWREFDEALRDRVRSLSQLIEQDEGRLIFEWQEGAGVPTPISVEREVLTVWSSGSLENVFPPQATPIEVPGGSRGRTWAVVIAENIRARAITLQFEPRIEPEDDEHPAMNLPGNTSVSLVFARATMDVDATIARLRWTLAIVGLLGVLATLGLTWLGISFGLRPIGAATDRIASIHAGTLGQRIDDSDVQPRELRPLLATINQLLGRLQQTFERERAFSADVAHELRTPLAGLRAKLDLALTRPRSTEEHEQTIRKCLEITEQTGAIVEILLDTTRTEVDATSDAGVPIPLRQLAVTVASEFDDSVEARKLTLLWEIPEHVTVFACRESLGMILRNLIDNAVNYADVASTINVVANQTESETRLAFSNQATDFPAGEIDKVFTRFWRADASRHETGDHSGLGLPLCRRLTQLLGGTLVATYEHRLFEVQLMLPR